ncbi:MAG: MFS transporter [Chloroflexi bacterium]|nr:MFS transporter [Chloroflexota bacterium]
MGRLRRVYFGYYVIAALFIAEIAVTGVSFYSFSLFITAWQDDTTLGWSLTAINGSFLIGLPLAFTSPLLGRFIDERGARLAMLLGVPLIGGTFILEAFMTEIWHLWVAQGLLITGQSAAFLGTGKLVGLWFDTDRGRMMGIALAGNNAGGVIMAPMSAVFIDEFGWRTTVFVFGVAIIVINSLLIWLWVRDKPEDVIVEARRVGREREARTAEALLAATASGGDDAASQSSSMARSQGVTWQESLRMSAFWLLTLAFVATFASIFAVLNQLAKHLEIVGISTEAAGAALGLLGAFGFLGKLIFGFLSERFPSRYGFAAICVLQVFGIIILLLLRTPAEGWLLWPFVAVYGIGFGAVGALMPLVVADTFGLLAYATIFGAQQLILRIVNGGLPPVVGWSVDYTGTYEAAFFATIVSLFIGAVAVVFARTETTAAR